MSRQPTGNPVGPPEKEIDWEMFENLCNLQCTQEEIAGMLKIHRDTLRYKVQNHYGEDYSAVYKKFSGGGKCSLRRNQFVLSKKNAAMAIWLGKQWLGQKDREEDDLSYEDRMAIKEFAHRIKQRSDIIREDAGTIST